MNKSVSQETVSSLGCKKEKEVAGSGAGRVCSTTHNCARCGSRTGIHIQEGKAIKKNNSESKTHPISNRRLNSSWCD